MIRKSSCTSVHCGFRIFANLEIPPFGLASLSHAPPCRVVSCHPGIVAVPCLHPSCPGCNCQKPHLSSLFHPILPYSPHPSHPFYSILFYSILSYPILSLPSIPLHGSPRYTWHAFRAFPCPVSLRSIPPVTVSCIPAIEKGLHRKSTIQPLLGGERGIRTPVPLLATTRFPGVPLKPLEHLSKAGANILIIFICTKKCRLFGKSTRLIRQLQPVRLRKSLVLYLLS